MKTGRKYQVLDVFTDTALAGNPLAVIFDANGLDAKAMQAIAREFNFSESVFVLPPDNPGHRARIRIFTPDYEMPFAGHPTVGSAIAIAGQDGTDNGLFVLEENIGPVRCAVSKSGTGRFAEFDLPRLPERLNFNIDKEAVGAALGLDPHEIGFENHVISLWSAGVPYVAVPVAGLDVAAKVKFDNAAWMTIAHPKAKVSLRQPMSTPVKPSDTTRPSMPACSRPAIPPTKIPQRVQLQPPSPAQ